VDNYSIHAAIASSSNHFLELGAFFCAGSAYTAVGIGCEQNEAVLFAKVVYGA
jgi:hypothetical protein